MLATGPRPRTNQAGKDDEESDARDQNPRGCVSQTAKYWTKDLTWRRGNAEMREPRLVREKAPKTSTERLKEDKHI